MNEEDQIQELIAAWNVAGRELGIRVVAPFELGVTRNSLLLYEASWGVT